MATTTKGGTNPKLTEAQFSKQIQDFLALDSWRVLRMEPVSRREWGRGFGEKGMPDLLAIRYGYNTATRVAGLSEVVWIEVKAKGGRAETHQINWHTMERARGALVLLAGVDFPAHFDGFAHWYAQSGLLRRKGLC